MTSEDIKDALRYLPKFWHSLVQLIIHSRLSEKIITFSKSPKQGSSMFNIEMDTNEKASQMVKEFYVNQALTPNNPFSVEILLKFQNAEQMVIEIWTLNIEENNDSSSVNICQVTDRMSNLLKSVFCASRTIPAYKYSVVQNPNDYQMQYRLFFGRPRLSNLGESQSQVRIGRTNIHCGYLSVHVAYRTNFAKLPRPKIATPEQPMMVMSDHFKMESSPKQNQKANERISESSETTCNSTSIDSQDLARYPFTMDLHSSPRSRTSSESSYKGTFPFVNEKIFIPFASKKAPPLEDFFLQEQSPSAQFLASAIEKLELEEKEYQKELQEKQKSRLKERKISETDSESKVKKEIKGSGKTAMNTSGQSNKSFASNATREDEFVLLDMKTPFAETSSSDFNAFLNEWHSAPPLKMFSNDSFDKEENSDEINTQNVCVTDQIESYEKEAEEFDELVKSFHTKDMNNSHEELG